MQILFNPMDSKYVANPYPTLARVREVAPRYWIPMLDSWMLTRHDDVREVLRSDDVRSLGVEGFLSMAGAKPHRGPFYHALEKWLVMLPPADHQRVRSLLHRTFSSRSIAQLEAQILPIAEMLLDAMLDKTGTVDVARDFAHPFPMLVIADQLGVPREDWQMFKRWSDDIARMMDPTTMTGAEPAADRTATEMFAYLGDIARARARQPKQDIISLLVQERDGNRRLSEQELLSNCLLMLFAGNETTMAMMCNSLLALIEHPEAEVDLRHEPGLLADAVDEFLRYDSPAPIIGRFATRDFQLREAHIRAGQRVMLSLHGANRDPEAFANPDTLDFTRELKSTTVAFGSGRHICLGAHLARLEMRLGLGAFLDRVEHFELATSRLAYRFSMALRSPDALPMRLTPARRRSRNTTVALRAQAQERA